MKFKFEFQESKSSFYIENSKQIELEIIVFLLLKKIIETRDISFCNCSNIELCKKNHKFKSFSEIIKKIERSPISISNTKYWLQSVIILFQDHLATDESIKNTFIYNDVYYESIMVQ